MVTHDRKLLQAILDALAEEYGKSWSPEWFLTRFVKPLMREERLKVVSVRLPTRLVERLDRLAEAVGSTRSELIREALQLFAENVTTRTAIRDVGCPDGELRTYTFKLGERELRRLDELAQRVAATRSQVVRAAIWALLEANGIRTGCGPGV